MHTSDPILSCKQITKTFSIKKRKIQVLQGIDLEIFPKEIVLIKGRSGEGKSVLQWILSGVDHPDSGTILFQGIPYNKMSREELSHLRRKKIGMVFQNFNLIPSWTALENVESALLNNIPKREKQQKAAELLECLGLSHRLDNLPIELSIGQQQRVALARALINQPSLIIADEPTGNVDKETGDEMIKLLSDYIYKNQASMLVTTHGDFHREELSSRRYILKNGILIQLEQLKPESQINGIPDSDSEETSFF